MKVLSVDEKQLRKEKWDLRFLRMCTNEIATWSKDPSTKVAALIVDANRRGVSFGYNGFPQLVNDDESRYADRELKYKIVLHGEENALLFANRDFNGCTIYTVPFPPCTRCAAKIIQVGIRRVVSYSDDILNPRWRADFELAEILYREAGVTIDYYIKNPYALESSNPPLIKVEDFK